MQVLLLSILTLLCVAFLLIIRAWIVLIPKRIKNHSSKLHLRGKGQGSDDGVNRKIPTMVVLGSGGHTTEMLKLIKRIDRNIYSPITFVIAQTDKTSLEKTIIDWKPSEKDLFVKIPRSREVGQSWISTIFSTLRALMTCVRIVYTSQPELLLCNGPGTCIPICASVLFFRFIGLQSEGKIAFCESFCRVTSLSLTGKLLYYLADEFVVHWPQLQRKYPKTRYLGVIC